MKMRPPKVSIIRRAANRPIPEPWLRPRPATRTKRFERALPGPSPQVPGEAHVATCDQSSPFVPGQRRPLPIGEIGRTGLDAARGRRAMRAAPAGIAVCVPVNTRTAKPSHRGPWCRLRACQPPKPSDRGHDDGFDPAMLTGKHTGHLSGPGRPPAPAAPAGPAPQTPAGSGSVTVVGRSASSGSVHVQAAPWCLPTAPCRAASTRSGRPKISMKPTADAWSKASPSS